MANILHWILANPETAGSLVLAIMSVLSGVFRAVGWTSAARWIGTFSVDVGRGLQWLAQNSKTVYALMPKAARK